MFGSASVEFEVPMCGGICVKIFAGPYTHTPLIKGVEVHPLN